jgi:transcriptional regulator with XRE-family HTH domain
MLVSLPPVDPELQAVGERLRSIREARGLTQLQLAEALGVAREALAQAERGRLRLTSAQLYGATLALRIPMRLLAEPATDLSRIRRL